MKVVTLRDVPNVPVDATGLDRKGMDPGPMSPAPARPVYRAW